MSYHVNKHGFLCVETAVGASGAIRISTISSIWYTRGGEYIRIYTSASNNEPAATIYEPDKARYYQLLEDIYAASSI